LLRADAPLSVPPRQNQSTSSKWSHGSFSAGTSLFWTNAGASCYEYWLEISSINNLIDSGDLVGPMGSVCSSSYWHQQNKVHKQQEATTMELIACYEQIHEKEREGVASATGGRFPTLPIT